MECRMEFQRRRLGPVDGDRMVWYRIPGGGPPEMRVRVTSQTQFRLNLLTGPRKEH